MPVTHYTPSATVGVVEGRGLYLQPIAMYRAQGEVRVMARKEIMDKLSIYIPQRKLEDEPVERLIDLGKDRDRSVNYLVVEAILQYLDREENAN